MPPDAQCSRSRGCSRLCPEDSDDLRHRAGPPKVMAVVQPPGRRASAAHVQAQSQPAHGRDIPRTATALASPPTQLKADTGSLCQLGPILRPLGSDTGPSDAQTLVRMGNSTLAHQHHHHDGSVCWSRSRTIRVGPPPPPAQPATRHRHRPLRPTGPGPHHPGAVDRDGRCLWSWAILYIPLNAAGRR